MENKVMTHITKGLLTGLILIIIGIAAYFGKFAEKSWYNWVSNIILFGAIIWGCIYYANQLDGKVTFGNIFAHGFKMSVVIALILIVYTAIAMSVLFPDMKDKALEMARQKMEEGGKLSEDQINQGIEMTKKFFPQRLDTGIVLR